MSRAPQMRGGGVPKAGLRFVGHMSSEDLHNTALGWPNSFDLSFMMELLSVSLVQKAAPFWWNWLLNVEAVAGIPCRANSGSSDRPCTRGKPSRTTAPHQPRHQHNWPQCCDHTLMRVGQQHLQVLALATQYSTWLGCQIRSSVARTTRAEQYMRTRLKFQPRSP